MIIMSIDGACRRNGRPDCIASGGVYIEYVDSMSNIDDIKSSCIRCAHESGSTNQRGELLALLMALEHILYAKEEALIVTDSEYIFNAMTKEWFKSWLQRGWTTAAGEPVKNADMWQEITLKYNQCVYYNIQPTFYHIKGHCISFGKVTATKLLSADATGAQLKREVLKKYREVCKTTKADKLAEANELSEKNNGFVLDDNILERFVVMNTLADAIATKRVEKADAES